MLLFKVRPDFPRNPLYGYFIKKWCQKLRTSESIGMYMKLIDEEKYFVFCLVQHIDLFESNLSQLFDQLRRLVYLEIYGKIPLTKVEPYRIMAQNRFPNGRIDIDMSRFRLWI